jgi:GDP-D-mannose 3', 5'-epimerase
MPTPKTSTRLSANRFDTAESQPVTRARGYRSYDLHAPRRASRMRPRSCRGYSCDTLAVRRDTAKPVLVAGAGGFIGGHLTGALLELGTAVRAVDIKPTVEWHQLFDDADNRQLDLRLLESCREAVRGTREAYNLAADMGGIGYIEEHKAACMLSVLINSHLLLAAREEGLERYLFSSSACVYPVDKQRSSDVKPLAEGDTYPALPEDGYGWEKLFSERMCRHFREDFGLETGVARYHNVYGPHGEFDGGREKAPAAICRKVAEAILSGVHEIEIWGDGEQTRSFMYIDDCVRGTLLIAASGHPDPVNLGSSELVTINHLVDIVESIAGVKLRRRYRLDAPQGVRGRNSDNTLIKERFGWEPSIPLGEGLEKTFGWIYDQLAARDLSASGRVLDR